MKHLCDVQFSINQTNTFDLNKINKFFKNPKKNPHAQRVIIFNSC
jgi:hypothetical protein